jgi:hypothetical protein
VTKEEYCWREIRHHLPKLLIYAPFNSWLEIYPTEILVHMSKDAHCSVKCNDR